MTSKKEVAVTAVSTEVRRILRCLAGVSQLQLSVVGRRALSPWISSDLV